MKRYLLNLISSYFTRIQYYKDRKFFDFMDEISHTKIRYLPYNQEVIQEKDKYKIAFIIPGTLSFSGGQTSVFRLGTYLSEMGHEIYYLTYSNDKKSYMTRTAKRNFPRVKGTFLDKDSLGKANFDIGVATFWVSCYYLLTYESNFKYKCYFVQDFEPFFYPLGDFYFLAQDTYKFGFHMITLGQWCKEQIKSRFPKSKVDYINFPTDLNEYAIIERNIIINKDVKIAAYLKLFSKRAPFLLIEQLKYLLEFLTSKGFNVEINIFGLDKNVKIPVGTNLGKLNRDELRELYQNSHFGIVASLTNISLVNYEMIASGLPVIDFRVGSAPKFFLDSEMILIESKVIDLGEKIYFYINNQKLLNDILKRGQEKLVKNKLDWENSARQFHTILINTKNSKL